MKKQLKLLLREHGVKQEDLYRITGYHFDEVKTIEDLNEVERLIKVYW